MKCSSLPAGLKSGCKINLSLRVGKRLENGWHAIDSVFLPLPEPHDVLEINSRENGVAVAFFDPSEPERALTGIDPIHNTLTRALAWYADKTGFAPSLDIKVYKNVPRGAGLGGGSANAAALLNFLQEEGDRAGFAPLLIDDLLKGAATVGADVPFFLLNKPARATGVGERLQPVANPFSGYFLLLACPGIHVSTAWAFAALDEARSKNQARDKKNDPAVLTRQDGQAIYPLAQARDFVNDFEAVVFSRFPELSVLYDRLVRSGAELTRMSGTGAAIFALYREERIAEGHAKMLANENMSVYIQRLPAG